MHDADGFGAFHEMFFSHRFERKIFVKVLHAVERFLDHLPHAVDLDSFCQRIDRDKLLERRQLFRCNGFRFRIAHLYFPIAIFCPSVGKDVQPTGEFILLPWLVEVSERHGARPVRHGDVQNGKAFSWMDFLHIKDSSVNDGLFPAHKVFHLRDLRPVLISSRVKGNEVFHSADAKVFQPFRHFRAYPFDIFNGI